MSDQDRSDLEEAIRLLRVWNSPGWTSSVREETKALLARHPEKPKLLPCPFCGERAEVVEPCTDRDFFIICTACEGMIQDAESAEHAAAAWNRRATPVGGPVNGGKGE